MKKLHQTDINPLRSRWPLIFGLLAMAALAGYFLTADRTDVTSKSTVGLVYGIVGFGSILFLAFLRVRKSFYAVKVGSLHAWVQSHVYIGLLSLLLILIHTGLNFSGLLSTLLFTLFSLVVGSGIVGMIVYTVTPSSLAKFGRELLSTDEVLERFEKHLEEADKTVEGTSEELEKFYKSKVRPLFLGSSTKWGYLFKEERQVLKDSKESFERFKGQLSADCAYDLNILASIHAEVERMHFKWAKMRALRGWLNMHVPLTVMMLVVAFAHIFSVIYY